MYKIDILNLSLKLSKLLTCRPEIKPELFFKMIDVWY